MVESASVQTQPPSSLMMQARRKQFVIGQANCEIYIIESLHHVSPTMVGAEVDIFFLWIWPS